MKCEKVHGQLYCGYDNIIMDDKLICRKPGIYDDVPDYFPEEPDFDNTIFICNNLKRDNINKKIFERKKCNQKVIPDYRPNFKVCNKYYNANNSRENPDVNLLTHPVIKQVPHCDGHYPGEVNLCKRDGLGYLKRVVLENELRCVNEYLSKTSKNFPGKYLLTSNTDPKNLPVSCLNLGPKSICDPFGMDVGGCINFQNIDEKCGPHGLMHVGENEKLKCDFLPIGPRRCDQKNRCEMIWDNVSKRQYINNKPAYVKPDDLYKPTFKKDYAPTCPPHKKYNYTCI